MKAYYYIQNTGQEVSADNPVEVDLDKSRRILNSLHGTGSFLGLEITQNHIVQFYTERGIIWTEILDVAQKLTVGCELNLPAAELALEAVYHGNDIQIALREAGYDWLDWREEKLILSDMDH